MRMNSFTNALNNSSINSTSHNSIPQCWTKKKQSQLAHSTGKYNLRSFFTARNWKFRALLFHYSNFCLLFVLLFISTLFKTRYCPLDCCISKTNKPQAVRVIWNKTNNNKQNLERLVFVFYAFRELAVLLTYELRTAICLRQATSNKLPGQCQTKHNAIWCKK